jgi:hypothetical protein
MERVIGRRLFTDGLERDVYEDAKGGSTSSTATERRCMEYDCCRRTSWSWSSYERACTPHAAEPAPRQHGGAALAAVVLGAIWAAR